MYFVCYHKFENCWNVSRNWNLKGMVRCMVHFLKYYSGRKQMFIMKYLSTIIKVKCVSPVNILKLF